ncbi:hypothetical protein G3580_16635 [Nitrogeniibacter mangrovi]|uniref:STAS/SEC14 domain-containing protein n=1 Tax=Nitrogeniibacter mangrovi TaxID=2016596 RepID=A0A6C1B837_9RHOO|nr:hypothetical protein [Nitrogeniibacter mangrovi]QID19099.1 hypothetical protein G3580_16635 [Nitrogeniibacter mangrovi]
MTYELVWEPRGAYKHFSGVVTADEFFGSIVQFQNHPDFDTAEYSINDFSDVDDFEILDKDVRRFTAYGAGAALTNPHLKIAIVARDDRVLRHVATYRDTGLAPFPLEVFDTVADARRWIGR